MPRISSTKLFSTLLVAGLASSALVRVAIAEQVGREQDINNLRLGQRIRVDDGSCPAGQVKEVSGAKMVSGQIARVRKCVPRVTKAR
jgi:uncharacterized protein DUF6719